MSAKTIFLCTTIAVFLLVACAHPNSDSPYESTNTHASTEQPLAPTIIQYNTYTAPYPHIPHKQLVFNTQANYDTYFAVKPDNFITYNMLQVLGGFCSYQCLSLGSFDDHFYTFSNSLGEDYLALYIYSKPTDQFSHSSLPVIETSSDSNDLSYNDAIRGVYTLGNIKYRYLTGPLNSISWSSATHVFILHIDRYDGSNTFVERLLNADTALDTVHQFNINIQNALSDN